MHGPHCRPSRDVCPNTYIGGIRHDIRAHTLRAQPDADTIAWVEHLEAQIERVRERYPLEIVRMASRSTNPKGP